MQEPTIISYFTKDTLYEKEAESLIASCQQFGFEYQIEGIESFGKWHEHTCYKPIYIYKKMLELKKPIVWIDADAQIVQKPSFDFDCDIALRVYDHYPPDHPCYPLTGTLFFNYTPEALSFVKSWAATCQKAIEEKTFTVDQQIFGWLLMEKKVKVQFLPPGYTAIFEEEIPKEEQYIIHYQASRLYKKIIDEGISFGIFSFATIDELRSMRQRPPEKRK